MHVVRRGSEATTRLFAPRFVRGGSWDVVVEEINTLPYFAHVWSSAPSVLFIPQLAREVWWYEAPKAVAWLGWTAEPLYLAAYRNVHAITISDSTSTDLRRFGLRKRIDVLPMAVSTPVLGELAPKEPTGELVTVGRLVPSKRFDHAIRALSMLRDSLGSARLTIIGDGRERANLEHLAEQLGLKEAIRFTGRIPESEKVDILERADVLVSCAVREGWGLTTTRGGTARHPSGGVRRARAPRLHRRRSDGRSRTALPWRPGRVSQPPAGRPPPLRLAANRRLGALARPVLGPDGGELRACLAVGHSSRGQPIAHVPATYSSQRG